MGDDTSLGDRLRSARTLAGISGRRLDDLAGLTPGHTNAIESGRRANVESRIAIALAEVLGVSLDWLLKGDGAGPTEDAVRAAVSAVVDRHCA